MSSEQKNIVDSWLRQASLEIMPNTQLTDEALSKNIMPDQKIYITFMGNSHIKQVIDLAKRLQNIGAIPVAHIAARHLYSKQQLHEYVKALQQAQVKHVLLLAGGPPQTAGPLSSSLELIESGLFDDDTFESVGFAAHPDGHPYADQASIQKAMQQKINWAQQQSCSTYFITQFVFESKPILQWLESLDTTNMLPIDIGLPGITQTRTLLRFASIAGISWQQVTSMILRHPWQWLRFLTQWSPKPIIEELAEYHQNNQHSPIAGLHFYTFGGFNKTAEWLKHNSN